MGSKKPEPAPQVDRPAGAPTSPSPPKYRNFGVYTEVSVQEWAALNQRVGFLEGVMLGLNFAVTYEEVRDVLERAEKRYEEIKSR